MLLTLLSPRTIDQPRNDGDTVAARVRVTDSVGNVRIFSLGQVVVRFAPGAFAPLVAQTFTEDTGPQTYTFAAATGANLTWAYSLVSPPAGVTLDGRTVTVDTDALPPQVTAYTVRATDQYGRAIDRTGGLTILAASVAPQTVVQVIDGQIVVVSLAALSPSLTAVLSGSDIAIVEAA